MSVNLSGVLGSFCPPSVRENYRYASKFRVLFFMFIVFGLSLLVNRRLWEEIK